MRLDKWDPGTVSGPTSQAHVHKSAREIDRELREVEYETIARNSRGLDTEDQDARYANLSEARGTDQLTVAIPRAPGRFRLGVVVAGPEPLSRLVLGAVRAG